VATAYYEHLALGWAPESKSDNEFKFFASIVVVILLTIGLILSSINVPVEERKARTVIPERIANFILEKEKPKPKPKPKPPKPVKKPVIKKTQKKPSELKKPITKAQKKARKKAADSGLLALSSELSDLMDTSDLSRDVGGRVNTNASAAKAASQNASILSDNVSKGSGGVNADKYATTVTRSKLTQREITQVKQSLLASDTAGSSKGKSRTGDVRAEEDVTIVFDQNKSMLYSIYNRERRKNPGLKGKIVLEITIAASGKVTSVRIVSSELNSPSLERRLVSRIKLFNFGAQPVKSLTVTYPIEFLPS
jgi:periplasmic protein TonB